MELQPTPRDEALALEVARKRVGAFVTAVTLRREDAPGPQDTINEIRRRVAEAALADNRK